MEYACIVRISFSDDGEDEIMVLAKGTKEQCEAVFEAVPAVSYGGDRVVKEAHISIIGDAP